MPPKTIDYREAGTDQGLSSFQAAMRMLRRRWIAIVVDLAFSVCIGLFVGLVLVPPDIKWLRMTVAAGAWLPLAITIYLVIAGIAWVLGRLIENNYKTLLIGRYLRRRRIAWVSLIAVTLCTTMVLVVISVMGGWLDMFEASARGLSGDLIVKGDSLSGFAGYEQMVERLQKLPGIVAAVPTLDTFGLLNIKNSKVATVHVLGLPIEQIGRVNNFPDSLYRQHIWLNDRREALDSEKRKLQRNAALSAAQKDSQRKAIDDEIASIDAALRRPPTFNLHDPVDYPVILPSDVKLLDPEKGTIDTGDPALNEKVRWISVPSLVSSNPPGKNEKDKLAAMTLETGDPSLNEEMRWIPAPSLISYGPLSKEELDKLTALSTDKAWGRALAQLQRESNWPGMIASTGTIEIYTDDTGKLEGRAPFKHHLNATLKVLGVSADGQVDLSNRADTSYWIMDDSHTGMWQYDMETVYVPFDRLQSDLGMGATTATDKATGQEYTLPARTTDIHIKLKDGVDPDSIKEKAQTIVDDVLRERDDQLLAKGIAFNPFEHRAVRVRTWCEAGAQYIGAIEHEKVLVVVLFSIMSIVAIFLIFCIFYMIVAEKTKDIGIIKSVGATNTGVAGIFLGYGLVIGLLGGALALLCSYGIIHNINYLHGLMATLMHIKIWSPETYAFDRIPNTMNPKETAIIVSIAVLSSVFGAPIPAIRAARMNPVEALRWE